MYDHINTCNIKFFAGNKLSLNRVENCVLRVTHNVTSSQWNAYGQNAQTEVQMQLRTSKFNSLISKFNSLISNARNEQQNLELGMQNSNINIGGNHPP
jgi:hypothetical protein